MRSPPEPWLDEKRPNDVETLAAAISEANAKGLPPDAAAAAIARAAAPWLPELAGGDSAAKTGSMAAWIKKKLVTETLVRLLPTEKDSLPCSFLLKLLRTAKMVGAEASCLGELEAMAGRQLDQASLKDLMIPSFSHTSSTLLDVALVLGLVREFAAMDEAAKSGAAIAKVAKLVDGFLAEAAADASLPPAEFAAIAAALPQHARASDDGLYRALDTYLKAHRGLSKEERRGLWRLVDARKMSSEAAAHAAQNERLPVRAVVEVVFAEWTKMNRGGEWSGALSGPRSPAGAAVELPARCPSKREVAVQQQEIRRLRDEVGKLQLQCQGLQAQVERLLDRKKKAGGFFRWRTLLFKQIDVGDKMEEEDALSRHTPVLGRRWRPLPAGTPTPRWRNSLS
ncbi:BTB/POZ domain-containing protein At5g48800-like [Wolffia australiana]